jgi:hypothetical protein
VFGHLAENVSRGVLVCGPLPLSRPVLQEAPQALAQIPKQIMVLPKQRTLSLIALTGGLLDDPS